MIQLSPFKTQGYASYFYALPHGYKLGGYPARGLTGDFAIYSDEYIKKYHQEGNYILFGNDLSRCGIIKRVFIDPDSSERTVSIKGFTLLHLLTQRITVPPAGRSHHVFSRATAEDVLKTLVQANCTQPADSSRRMPILECAPSKSRGDRLSYQTRYDPLADAIT